MNKILSQALKKAVSEYSPQVIEVPKGNRPDLFSLNTETEIYQNFDSIGSNYTVDTKADIWACGCLLFVLCFHHHPFEDSAKLAIVNGTDNFDSGLQPGVDKFIGYLNKINFPREDLLYWVDEKGSHSSRSWSHQAKDILLWMYK